VGLILSNTADHTPTGPRGVVPTSPPSHTETLPPPTLEPEESAEPAKPTEIKVEWESNGPEESSSICYIMMDQQNDSSIIYAVGMEENERVINDIWTSEDFGQTWTHLPDNPYQFDFGEKGKNWEEKTLHGGSEIQEFDDGQILSLVAPHNMYSPHLHPGNPYLTIGEIDYPIQDWFISVNGGASWFKINLPPPYDPEAVGLEEARKNYFAPVYGRFYLLSDDNSLHLVCGVGKVWYAKINLRSLR